MYHLVLTIDETIGAYIAQARLYDVDESRILRVVGSVTPRYIQPEIHDVDDHLLIAAAAAEFANWIATRR